MMIVSGGKIMNMIQITEQENRLYFDGNYTPVVCGNSNYFIKFDFSPEWARCYHKTAVFVVGDRKKQMKFEGNIQLPNIYIYRKQEKVTNIFQKDICVWNCLSKHRFRITKSTCQGIYSPDTPKQKGCCD
jgi:hypothetical protein